MEQEKKTAYKVKLLIGDGIIDEREVSTDDELFATFGRFAVWYFLALDAVDYRDAYNAGGSREPDALLAFTCDKANDKPGCRRHGMPNGQLARGNAWPDGIKHPVTIKVSRIGQ